MTSYREAAAITPIPPETTHAHVHPRESCPECGAKNAYTEQWDETLWREDAHDRPVMGRICSPHRRARSGFLWLKRCSTNGTHTHQHCRRCGAAWTTGVKLESEAR